MAIVEQLSTKRRVTLGSPTVIGRSSACALRIRSAETSSSHASIQWNGETWLIHDLNSRNGTYVDGHRLRGDTRVELRVGARLDFGVVGEPWCVLDTHPPVASFICMDTEASHAAIVEDHGTIVFPDTDPLVTAFRRDGGDWCLEQAGLVDALEDGHELELDGATWRFSVPPVVLDSTVATDLCFGLSEVTIDFKVSADEEDVEIELRRDGAGVIDLGTRASYYPLLVLARARLDCVDPQDPEAGWLLPETLAEMIRMEVCHLNVHVFRARKYMGKSGMRDALSIIERRSGSGKMRIGTARLSIRNH